jgi:hypothetical protein
MNKKGMMIKKSTSLDFTAIAEERTEPGLLRKSLYP